MLTFGVGKVNHTVDSVIESSLQDIILRKSLELNNLRWHFSGVIMNSNKVIPENMVDVC